MYAVLLLAIRDATSNRAHSEEADRYRKEAIEWVFEDPAQPLRPMSCRWLCEALGVPFCKVARVVQAGPAPVKKYFH